jgi:hypothetical protein
MVARRRGERMSAVTLWITVIGVVLVVAYLVAPRSQAPRVLGALGKASADNIRALAGGVG